MTVLYLGPEGTFTHQAARIAAPEAGLQPVDGAAVALSEVNAGNVDCAILPIDNSVNGLVIPTLDALLANIDVRLAGSVVLPVSFVAMTTGPDVVPTVIVSHPHALAQCSNFVEDLGLPTRAAPSTAAACSDLKRGEVALGSSLCVDLYERHVYQREVEDNTTAFTQFGIFAKDGFSVPMEIGEDGFVVVVTPNKDAPGTLRSILDPLSTRWANLANIATRPVPGSPGRFHFIFFVDGQLSESMQDQLEESWASLHCSVRFLGRLGSLAAGARDLVDGNGNGTSPVISG